MRAELIGELELVSKTVARKTNLEIYEDWIETLTGEEQKIKAYDGDSIFNILNGRGEANAYFLLGSRVFGYNTKKMDEVDDISVMYVAAHECGHYWIPKINYVFPVICLLMIAPFCSVFGLLGTIVALLIFQGGSRIHLSRLEKKADEFAYNVFGADFHLSAILDMTRNRFALSNRFYKEVKNVLERTGIEYETYL